MSLIWRDECPALISAKEKRLSCIKNTRKMCVFCYKHLLLRTSNRCVFQKQSDDHAVPSPEWLLFAFLDTLSNVAHVVALSWHPLLCNGTLLTGVRKSCKGRAVLPKPAHQVTAEAEKVGAVRTKPANSAAAESTAPTKLSPLGARWAKREGADRPRRSSFFFPTPEIPSGGCSCWLAVWHQELSGSRI